MIKFKNISTKALNLSLKFVTFTDLFSHMTEQKETLVDLVDVLLASCEETVFVEFHQKYSLERFRIFIFLRYLQFSQRQIQVYQIVCQTYQLRHSGKIIQKKLTMKMRGFKMTQSLVLGN